METSGVGLGALWGSVHLLRVMVNRGLVSPNEVDTIFHGVMEGLNFGGEPNPEVEAGMEKAFAELRQWAKERWVGGPNDPESLGEAPR
jgi:hypothetical protein